MIQLLLEVLITLVKSSCKDLLDLQSEHFPFLGVSNNGNQLNETRCWTTFYTALGRLLMVDLGEDDERFERFMMPLTGVF